MMSCSWGQLMEPSPALPMAFPCPLWVGIAPTGFCFSRHIGGTLLLKQWLLREPSIGFYFFFCS